MNDGTLCWVALILDGEQVGQWRPAYEVTTDGGWVRLDVEQPALTAAIAIATSPDGPIADVISGVSSVKPGDWVGFRVSDVFR